MTMLKHHVVIIDDRAGSQNELSEAFDKDTLNKIEFHESVFNCLTRTAKEPHLIIVEHKMVQMDGISAIKLLRKRWRKARIVLNGVSNRGCKKINRKKYKIDQTIPLSTNSNLLIEEIRINGIFYKVKWFAIQILLISSFSVIALFLFY
jgi:DNA-binding NarL/FixJ family response regulator